MKNGKKFVFFDIYCPTCEYFGKEEEDSPCDECLTIPARTDSHKPEYWKGEKE